MNLKMLKQEMLSAGFLVKSDLDRDFNASLDLLFERLSNQKPLAVVRHQANYFYPAALALTQDYVVYAKRRHILGKIDEFGISRLYGRIGTNTGTNAFDSFYDAVAGAMTNANHPGDKFEHRLSTDRNVSFLLAIGVVVKQHTNKLLQGLHRCKLFCKKHL